jgi:hypothetical protein
VDGETVEVFLGIGEEQQRLHTILTPRLAWPGSGYAAIEDEVVSEDEVDRAGASDLRRTILRRGAKSVLSYSWYERAGSLPVEWIRHAAALDRSPLARPRHMLAVRISTSLGVGGTRLEAAESRIQRVRERLLPELDDFAPTHPRR